jgi:RNA polymerase sigma-70 factor, ECF subfamily
METDPFEEHRRYLAGIAYRMLGSAAESDDVLQDAWVRWNTADRSDVVDPRAWLSRTVVRLCIDRLTSARSRREVYPGTWLPEPVLTETPLDLDSIELGFLVLLERLNPVERAVFLLHQVFEYSHAEVADILNVSEPASRQLLHRAREHLGAGRARFEASRATHERLRHAFMRALSLGDVDAISSVLAADAVLYGDGGGKVRGAILHPVVGRDRVARFFAGVLAKTKLPDGLAVDVEDVNGWPALIGRAGAAIHFVITIETDGAQITTIRNVVNPEKLDLRRVD